ncbi:hypothetical protein [Burkholderia ubonensis]|uniref:hypothetical protein n=1 Tax=Burkholderia ubonensis TaxID=101571 RepID=UPI0015C40043|nr:hypothetical protein [Burkholderia ubonensis]
MDQSYSYNQPKRATTADGKRYTYESWIVPGIVAAVALLACLGSLLHSAIAH